MAWRGARDTGAGVEPIEDAGNVEALRRRALAMVAQAALIAALVTTLLVVH
ncbi:MAG: hypothetical protein ACYTGN_02705 [Planctomycetota bacterium]